MRNIDSDEQGASPLKRELVRAGERYWLWRAILGGALSFFVGIVGVCQTQFFVSLLPRLDDETIRREMISSRSTQKTLAVGYQKRTGKEPIHGIVVTSFSESIQKRVSIAIQSIVNDEALETELQSRFGTSLKEMNAVVIPSWELNESDNGELLGITSYGRALAVRTGGEFEPGVFTLRDRDALKPVTEDGTPRIALSPTAFASDRALRLNLVHGLFHAMNVPGYSPSRLTFVQNDLTYLSAYRTFVTRQHLEGSRELMIWLFAVIVPWIITVLCIGQGISAYRNRLRYQDNGLIPKD